MSEQKRENGLLARGQSLIRDILLAVFGFIWLRERGKSRAALAGQAA